MTARTRTIAAGVGVLLATALLAGCEICDPIFKDPTLGPALAPLKETADKTKNSARAVTSAAEESVEKMTEMDERAIGQATALKVISERGGLLLDAKLVAYVNEVGNAVAQQGKRISMNDKGRVRTHARRFFFGVVDDPSWNAWSTPGGYIFVTRGMLEALGSESDLAFVLGHEIVHVDFEHNLVGIKAEIRAKAGTNAFLKETNLAGTNSRGEPGFDSDEFFDKIVGFSVDLLLNCGLQKGAEREADRTGLQYAIAAGYDARGAERLLTLLEQNIQHAKLCSQHDSPPQRLAMISDEIAKAPPGTVGRGRYEAIGIPALENAIAEKSAQAAAEKAATEKSPP